MPNTKVAASTGPTLNKRYNKTLASWGPSAKPECEDCGADLTGKAVVETPYDWRCQPCGKKFDPEDYADEPREDFHADL